MGKGPGFKRKFREALELPAEVVEGTPKITLLGVSDMIVENQQGVYEYYEKGLSLLTRCGILVIEGEGLELKEFSRERAYIRGEIWGIRFEKR